MTIAKLEKAKQILNDINFYEKIHNAFKTGYGNYLTVKNEYGEKIVKPIFDDSKLYKIINEHLENKVAELKQEFGEL